jgi:hypothetical protein
MALSHGASCVTRCKPLRVALTACYVCRSWQQPMLCVKNVCGCLPITLPSVATAVQRLVSPAAAAAAVVPGLMVLAARFVRANACTESIRIGINLPIALRQHFGHFGRMLACMLGLQTMAATLALCHPPNPQCMWLPAGHGCCCAALGEPSSCSSLGEAPRHAESSTGPCS